VNNQLKRIENICLPDGDNTSLSPEVVSSFPDQIQELFQCKVFGENILALPNTLDKNEHQRPFHFVNSNEKLKTFEQEFREAVPTHFHLIGYFHFGQRHSVTCLMNSKKRSQFMMIEMRNDQLYCDHEYINVEKELKGQYLEICKEKLDDSFEIHYAPRWIWDHFKNSSTKS